MISSVNNAYPFYFQTPLQGMRQAIEQVNKAAERISQGEVTPENMVSTMEANILFKANAKVVKVQDQMLGSLLDEKA